MKKLLILIPAYNEEKILERNMIKLHNFLQKNIENYDWKIIVSDNASIDKTGEIADKLERKYKRIKAVHLNKRPMSYSIKTNWLSENADIYIHMDADLSTDISHIPQLIKGIEEGYDIVTGSRNAKDSKTSRSFRRNFVSLVLIFLVKLFFPVNLTDFQCGFKAISRKVRDNILPKMKALNVGFMSTEMLVIAHEKGHKIKEISIIWHDYRKSKGSILKGIIDALINIIRIKINLIKRNY